MANAAVIGRILSTAADQRLTREAVEALRNSLSAGTVSLGTGVTTTTLTDPLLGPNSFIGFTALDANAAAEIGGATFYVSARGAGTATITHSNSGSARSLMYCVVGK